MAYSVQLWSEMRTTLGTVLRYPNVRILLDHSGEVRTRLSHHTNFHQSWPSPCSKKLTKGMQMPECLVEFRSDSGTNSVFALQVKTAILRLQCYQQTVPRQQKKMGKL